MQVAILIGLQAAGKSTFCRERFFETHIRLNLDMLKTRHRETLLFQACLEAKQPAVIDNTNPILEDRSRYIFLAKAAHFKVIGYYFKPNLQECLQRNQQRSPERIVPKVGVLATYKKLIAPSFAEGFDELYSVQVISSPNSTDRIFKVDQLKPR